MARRRRRAGAAGGRAARGRGAHARRAGALAGSALAALLAAAPAAALAHTSLVAAEPAPGGVAAEAPRALTLRFDEDVAARLAVVHVVGPDGRRVDRGTVAPASGATRLLRVPLRGAERGGAADGTYAVAYRIVSVEDGHTIPGGYRFSIGRGGPPPPVSLGALIDGVGPAPGAGAELDVARGLRDGGLVVALGGLIALLMVWRPALADVADPSPAWRRAARDGGRALRRLVAGAALAGALGSLALVALQGAAARGGGIADVLGGAGIGAVAGTRFGAVGLAAAAILAALAVVVALSGRERRDLRRFGSLRGTRTDAGREVRSFAPPGGVQIDARGELRLAELGATGVAVPMRADGWLVSAAAVAVVLLPLVPALTGHAAARDADQAVPLGAAHVLGAGVWVGGVAALGAALLAVRTLAPDVRRRLAQTLVRRFSPWALGAVGLIALTGLLQSVERLSTPGDLTATAYGRALLAKAGLLLIVAGVAAGHRDAGDRAGRRIVVELGGMAAILAATAALSGHPPPDATAPTAGGGAGAAGAPSGAVALDFHAARLEGALAPARAGRTTLAFGLARRDGRAFTDLERVRVTLTPPSGRRIVRTLPARRDGRYRVALDLPRAGDWRLHVVLEIDRFISYRRTSVVPVG